MESFVLRPARPADIDDVLRFWEVAAEDAHRPTDTAGEVRRLIQRDPEALLLAVDSGAIIGSVIAGWDGGRFDALVLDGNDLAHRAWAAAGYRRQPEWSRCVASAPKNNSAAL